VPKSSLPVRLALLVAGTTLPLIIFATVLVFNDYEQDRRDASQRVLETVHSIRLVLDAEVQRMTGGLQVLSLTNALRGGDFDNFRRIANGFLDQYGRDGVVLVSARDGRQLFSSVTTDTASLPPRNNKEIVEKVERQVIERVMRKVRGNQSLGARLLNISRGSLIAKMKEYDIKDFRYLKRGD